MKRVYKKKKKIKKEDIVLVEKKELKKETKVEVEETYKVDIKGEINNPGIYSMNKDKRVMDVIAEAGGLTENANTSVINLSKKIKDEMVIIIYSNEEVNDFKKTKAIEKQVEEKCIQKDENALINNACITQQETKETISTDKVNINTASIEELTKLTGIGESKAKEIIKYRETNNGFKSIEELTSISGIGENIFAQIKENITV